MFGISDRKQRTCMGKYSFVNRTMTNWNRLLAETLGSFPCKSKIFRKRIRKAVVSGLKQSEWKCEENSLDVQ
jgi:hypothetical protein